MNSPQHRIRTSFFALTRTSTLIIFTMILGGCLESTSPIRIEANTPVFTPSVRAAVNLDSNEISASDPRSGHAIELTYKKSRGHGSQTLASGDLPVVLDNTTFLAPQTLRNDFDFEFADISWRWRKFFVERKLGLEVSGGVGYTTLELATSSPVQAPASEIFFNRGARVGVGLIWRLNSESSIQLHITEFMSDYLRGVTNIDMREWLFVKQLHENISLRAGYAESGIYGTNVSGNSEFRVRFHGPVMALDMNFNSF